MGHTGASAVSYLLIVVLALASRTSAANPVAAAWRAAETSTEAASRVAGESGTGGTDKGDETSGGTGSGSASGTGSGAPSAHGSTLSGTDGADTLPAPPSPSTVRMGGIQMGAPDFYRTNHELVRSVLSDIAAIPAGPAREARIAQLEDALKTSNDVDTFRDRFFGSPAPSGPGGPPTVVSTTGPSGSLAGTVGPEGRELSPTGPAPSLAAGPAPAPAPASAPDSPGDRVTTPRPLDGAGDPKGAAGPGDRDPVAAPPTAFGAPRILEAPREAAALAPRGPDGSDPLAPGVAKDTLLPQARDPFAALRHRGSLAGGGRPDEASALSSRGPGDSGLPAPSAWEALAAAGSAPSARAAGGKAELAGALLPARDEGPADEARARPGQRGPVVGSSAGVTRREGDAAPDPGKGATRADALAAARWADGAKGPYVLGFVPKGDGAKIEVSPRAEDSVAARAARGIASTQASRPKRDGWKDALLALLGRIGRRLTRPAPTGARHGGILAAGAGALRALGGGFLEPLALGLEAWDRIAAAVDERARDAGIPGGAATITVPLMLLLLAATWYLRRSGWRIGIWIGRRKEEA